MLCCLYESTETIFTSIGRAGFISWDQAVFSFRLVNKIPASKAKRRKKKYMYESCYIGPDLGFLNLRTVAHWGVEEKASR